MGESSGNNPGWFVNKLTQNILLFRENLTLDDENAPNSFKARLLSIPIITDHTGDTSLAAHRSISFRASKTRSPVRKAIRTASKAAGISSTIVVEVPIAAAAREPVHNPRTVVFRQLGYGIVPYPWSLVKEN